MRISYSLYDRLPDRRALARAFEKVGRAQGAPGVDRQTIADFQSGLAEELDQLVTELRTRTYQPQPVRRVSIPKPDGGERHLGIPAGSWLDHRVDSSPRDGRQHSETDSDVSDERCDGGSETDREPGEDASDARRSRSEVSGRRDQFELDSHSGWAISNAWLSQLGLFDLSAIPTGVLPQVT